MAAFAYWSQDVHEVARQVGSSVNGLSTGEAQDKLKQAGPNSIRSAKRVSALGLLAAQFKSPIVVILILATLVSAYLRDWVDAVIILLIVLGSVLLWLMRANESGFQTGWFVESILSAATVVFVLRTRGPFLRSRPSAAMLAMTALVALVTLALPYTPLAKLLGFVPLSPLFLGVIFAIVALYVTAAELTKHWFYRHFGLSIADR